MKPNPNRPQSAESAIRAVKIRREDDDALLYCFFIPLESGTEKRVALSQALTFSELAKELRKFTADIADDRSTAAEQVEAIIKKASEEVLIGATKVGWKQPNRKSATFVTPTWIKGPDGSRYAWLGPEEKSKSTAGSTAGWLAKIATPSMGSSYLSFALMLGLAGPLRKFADDLPEGAVFHFHGKDTTGKTTASRVAASVFRSPNDLPSWALSERNLEELAGGHVDHLLILNAAEKARDADKKAVLQSLTHRIAEGKGKSRSQTVQAILPDVMTRSPILSTGNHSGPEMAKSVK